jgi:hypothetical protein
LHDAPVLPPVGSDLEGELAVHRCHLHRLGDVDVAGEQIARVEAEGEVVVGPPEQEHGHGADRDEQRERDPVPGADAVRKRASAEERARNDAAKISVAARARRLIVDLNPAL